MGKASVYSLKASRKEAKQQCTDSCRLAEKTIESLNSVDFDGEDILQWIKEAREFVKIKDVDEPEA